MKRKKMRFKKRIKRKAKSELPPGIILKTPQQIEGIRKAGQLTRDVLDMLTEKVTPGITTNQIDCWIYDYTVAHGGKPATLGYKGYPKSTCTSINNIICHGIPDETVLNEGDIVNIDVTSIFKGYFGDASRMYTVGQVSAEAQKLVDVTRECLEIGIAQVKPGNTIGHIGYAIFRHARIHGYSVVREWGGHGTGVKFHEEPHVSHYGRRGEGVPLAPGMTFTIEPMINMGKRHGKLLEDEWTVITVDGSLSAQWEHTVAVTEDGVDVLTA
jgi:methionyl aminopeptidase